MPKPAPGEAERFQVIDRLSVNTNWNGSPVVLNPGDNVNMPITPNGSMLLAWFNQSNQNNTGSLSLTSGGSEPTFETVPPLALQPSVLVNDWLGNNLSVTNISNPGSQTPIWVAAFGPGIPGQTPQNLPSNGTPVQLSTLATAQGTALPRYMQIVLTSNSGSLAVFVIIGGPATNAGNNAYVIAVNSSQNSGPGTNVTPPVGYYATTTANNYIMSFNWGSSSVFVAGMSPLTSLGASVKMYPL
jgi:hypothetical protein